MHAFHVHEVGYTREPDLNTETLSIVGEWDGDDAWPGLMVQRSLEVDEQDELLGQDTYCLVDEHQNTTYGGVTQWWIGDGCLVIALDQAAAAEMGVDGGYRLRLMVAEDAVSELAGHLDRLLGMGPTEPPG